MMGWLLILLVGLPCLGSVINYASKAGNQLLPCLAVFLSCVLSFMFLLDFEIYHLDLEWFPGIRLKVFMDKTTLLLISLVLFISLLVHVFSVAYLETDLGKNRYFAKLGFFTAAMVCLLLCGDLLSLFLFWELVGFSSYLLIGFWYTKDKVPYSARLAFMVNRVADACLLAGVILVWTDQGTFLFSDLSSIELLPSFLICLGAFGKSAQLPFSGWLIRAMAGPTPVSALIHAATMVTAGVYLLVRLSLVLDPVALQFLAYAGSTTALYGGICALFQYDIKKVLAYSTISQLGYMMMGVGVGVASTSLFHLLTHGFFKAGLFLGAAAIIHSMHELTEGDSQDMRNMGGLRRKLHWVFPTFIVCGAALVGLPFFSGFLSKEALIIASWQWASAASSISMIVPVLSILTVLLTAFYVMRMVVLTFFREKMSLPTLPTVEPTLFKIPLAILAIGSLWFWYNPNPFGHRLWFQDDLFPMVDYQIHGGFGITLISLSSVFVGGLFAYAGISRSHFFDQNAAWYKMISFSREGMFIDNLYRAFGGFIHGFAGILLFIDRNVVDWIVNAAGIFLVVFSKVAALVDRFFVDGLVKFLGWLATSVGTRLAGLSSRDGQVQFAWLLLGIIAIFLFFVLS